MCLRIYMRLFLSVDCWAGGFYTLKLQGSVSWHRRAPAALLWDPPSAPSVPSTQCQLSNVHNFWCAHSVLGVPNIPSVPTLCPECVSWHAEQQVPVKPLLPPSPALLGGRKKPGWSWRQCLRRYSTTWATIRGKSKFSANTFSELHFPFYLYMILCTGSDTPLPPLSHKSPKQ